MAFQPSGRSIPHYRTQRNSSTYGLANSTMAARGNASPLIWNAWAMTWSPTFNSSMVKNCPRRLIHVPTRIANAVSVAPLPSSIIEPSHNPGCKPHLSILMDLISPLYSLTAELYPSPASPGEARIIASIVVSRNIIRPLLCLNRPPPCRCPLCLVGHALAPRSHPPAAAGGPSPWAFPVDEGAGARLNHHRLRSPLLGSGGDFLDDVKNLLRVEHMTGIFHDVLIADDPLVIDDEIRSLCHAVIRGVRIADHDAILLDCIPREIAQQRIGQ